MGRDGSVQALVGEDVVLRLLLGHGGGGDESALGSVEGAQGDCCGCCESVDIGLDGHCEGVRCVVSLSYSIRTPPQRLLGYSLGQHGDCGGVLAGVETDEVDEECCDHSSASGPRE